LQAAWWTRWEEEEESERTSPVEGSTVVAVEVLSQGCRSSDRPQSLRDYHRRVGEWPELEAEVEISVLVWRKGSETQCSMGALLQSEAENSQKPAVAGQHHKLVAA